MAYKLKYLLQPLLIIGLLFVSCSKDQDIDVTGNESVNQRFNQSMEWNNTHTYREIIIPADDYNILCMADSHVGSTNSLDHFFNIAETVNTSAIVMVGDLTTGHVSDYAIFEQHLPDQSLFPLFLMVGNHDLHYDGWKEFYTRFGSSTYYFTVKTPVATDLYICLDTGGGTLGNLQLDWLTNILQTIRPDCRHCILFTHNNIFRLRHTDSTNPLTEEILVLIELFTTEYHVDMFIAGHDHKQSSELFGITTYLVMDALKNGLPNAGYLQTGVKNGKIVYKFKKIGN